MGQFFFIMAHAHLLKQIETVLKASSDQEKGLHFICQLLHDNLDNFDWVGYYLHSHNKKELVLKTYVGDPTDHTHIPFGKGICGQVALSNESFIVDDVTTQDNYISCSINVKSEIVVPLFINGQNKGQIDIDSNKAKAFTDHDDDFLTKVNRLVALYLF